MKGAVGQAIVRAILTSAGYRVVPFGVEETLREISVLSEPKYRRLRLPPVLRKMPDFVVATKKLDDVKLVEVKYRSSWSDAVRSGLFRSLQPQVKIWPNITLVVVFGSSRKRDADIRCLRLTSNAERDWYLEVDHAGKNIN